MLASNMLASTCATCGWKWLFEVLQQQCRGWDWLVDLSMEAAASSTCCDGSNTIAPALVMHTALPPLLRCCMTVCADKWGSA